MTPENLLAVRPETDDVLMAQFQLPLDAGEAFLRQGKEAGATTMLNPSPVRTDARHLLALADIVVVNARELAASAGMPPSDQLGGEEVQRGAGALEGGGDFGFILFRASVAASLSVEQPGTATAMPARRIVDAEAAAHTVPGVTAGGAVPLLSAGEV